MLTIGLLSFAHVHAAGYATLLNAREDVRLLAADPAPAYGEVRGRELADQLGVTLLDSYDAVFDAHPDAVVVCSETSAHRTLVERAAQSGAHVLCEKPLATTLTDARAMIDACTAAGVILMTAYPVRFHPSFRQLRTQVRAGRLGAVLSAAGTNNGQAPMGVRRWFVDPDLAGGGSLMDHTVHLADLLDDLLDARAVEVYAQTNRIVHGEVAEVETGGLVAVTYSDGTVATIDCSWSKPATFPRWGGLTLEVQGAGGSAVFDAFSHQVTGYDDRSGRAVSLSYGADLDGLMVGEFLTAIREGRPAQPDGEVGYRTLAIVAAAYESVRTGQPAAVTM